MEAPCSSELKLWLLGFYVLLSRSLDPDSPEDRKLLQYIGTTSVVSSSNDHRAGRFEKPIPFATGLLTLVKKNKEVDDASSGCFWSMLARLNLAECLDKQTILGIIELGSESVSSAALAANILDAVAGALCGDVEVDDRRFAFAVKAGLFEMLLDFLVRFGNDRHVLRAVGHLFRICSFRCPGAKDLKRNPRPHAKDSRRGECRTSQDARPEQAVRSANSVHSRKQC